MNLFLIAILGIAASTTPASAGDYLCSAYDADGVYARVYIKADSLKNALLTANSLLKKDYPGKSVYCEEGP